MWAWLSKAITAQINLNRSQFAFFTITHENVYNFRKYVGNKELQTLQYCKSLL